MTDEIEALRAEVEDESISSRFQINALLGEGASKRVYRAYDLVLEREVAIGLRSHAAGIDSMDDVLAEAQTMARVSTHSGIVTIFDVASQGSTLCLVSEYLPGGNLRDRMQGQPLALPLAIRTFTSIVAALGFAHLRGVIHRDVKPENIVFDAHGDAKLADFGLASFAIPGELLRDGKLAGTLAYMAPEQLYGSASSRSDLYAAGCVLYEMLTGRPPFEAPSPADLMDLVLQQAPAAPRERNPEVPPALNRLCLRLLEKQPERRPASARHALDEIRAARRGSKPVAAATRAGDSGFVDTRAHCFVGRSAELAIVERMLGEERSHLLLVEGEAGIGKTHLLDELARRAGEIGYSVWRGASLESTSIPLKPILDSLLRNAAELDRVVPGSRRVLDVVTGVHREGDFDAALYRLALTLVELSERRPLLLMLDDLHWADDPTIRLLDHVQSLLTSGTGRARLVLIAAHRPLRHGFTKHRTIASWARSPLCERLLLAGFDDAHTRSLVAGLTGLEPSARLLHLVQETTRGNPLFIRELLSHFDEREHLHDRDGALSSDAELDDIDLPGSLASIISLSIDQLGPEAAAVARMASCFGAGFRPSVLAKASGASLAEILARLGESEAAGLVQGKGDRFAFRHPLFRKALYDAMPNSERLASHGAIGRALRAGAPETPLSLIEVANHAALSFDFSGPELSIELMIRAARAALERNAWDHVIRFCEAVLDTLETGRGAGESQRIDLHHLAGCAYHQIAEVDRAINHLQTAAALARAGNDRERLAEALQVLVRMQTNFGRVRPGRDPETGEIESLIREFGASDPSRSARLMDTMSNSMLAANRMEEAASWAQRACETARRDHDDRLFAHTGHALAIAQWELLEPGESLATWREAHAAAQRAASTAMQARCLQRIPSVLYMLGRVDEIPPAVAAARSASGPIHRTGELTLAIAAAGGADLARGDLAGAGAALREGIGLMRESGYVGAAVTLVTGQAYLAAVTGDGPGAKAALELMLTPGEVFDEPAPLRSVVARHARLIRALLGERAAVREELRADPPPPLRTRLRLQRAAAYCLAAETAWEADAWTLAESCYEPIRIADEAGLVLVPGWPLLVRRVRGCVAAMLGDGSLAEQLLNEALEIAEARDMRAEIAKAHLGLARLYAADPSSAGRASVERHCRVAHRSFEACGMEPYLRAVEEVLAGAG